MDLINNLQSGPHILGNGNKHGKGEIQNDIFCRCRLLQPFSYCLFQFISFIQLTGFN